MNKLPEGVTLSPQEIGVLALQNRAFDTVVSNVTHGLDMGRSPGLLAIARPDLTLGFASAWQSSRERGASGGRRTSYKAPLFDATRAAAEAGDAAALAALPKFATTAAEVDVFTALMLDDPEGLEEQRTGAPAIQYIGSFNPQHVGHRDTMRRAYLAGDQRGIVVPQVVDTHPIKKDLPPYDGRFEPGEQKIYTSPIIDPTRVTLLDVPVGVGLAKVGAEQIRLIADVAGDPDMRWIVGSDKFLTDVGTVQQDKPDMRAGTRFADPRMHLYVARRIDHGQDEVDAGIKYIQDRYGTKLTVLPEPEDPVVLDAAASKIRALRAAGDHAGADRFEFGDFQ